MTPTTEAGRRLQGQLAYDHNPEVYLPGDIDTRYDDAIIAIEAEARAALLAELTAGVERLPGLVAAGDGGNLIWGVAVSRAAVLDLIRKAGEA